MSLAMLAIIAGLLQALGYYIYIRKSLRNEVEPNPTTWFMFAYGTVILTVLEFDLNANWTLLLLPVVCAVSAVFVALLCLKRGTLRWPKHAIDKSAFVVDVGLTLAYIGVWYAASQNLVSEGERTLLILTFLVLTNLSTIVEFTPLMKGTLEDPRSEHPFPWFIWTAAYATLGYVTYYESGWTSEFMLYPAINTALHAIVCVLATRRWMIRRHRSPAH